MTERSAGELAREFRLVDHAGEPPALLPNLFTNL